MYICMLICYMYYMAPVLWLKEELTGGSPPRCTAAALASRCSTRWAPLEHPGPSVLVTGSSCRTFKHLVCGSLQATLVDDEVLIPWNNVRAWSCVDNYQSSITSASQARTCYANVCSSWPEFLLVMVMGPA